MKLNFTKRELESIAAPASGKVVRYDSATRGLGIKVEPSGKKFFFWYRKVRGRPTWVSIGAYPEISIDDARQHAAERNVKLARWKASGFEGAPPFERPASLTLDSLVEEYIVKHLRGHAKRPASAEKHLRWYVAKYFATLRTRAIAGIRFEDVAVLHRKIGAKHATQANIAVGWLSTLFNFARRARIFTGDNPAKGHLLNEKVKRDRYITTEELPQFLSALSRTTNLDLKDFVGLALWTAARKADVLSMRWQDISLTGDNSWTVPNPKNRKPYVIPLTDESLAILRERLARAERAERESGIAKSSYVFPSYGEAGHVVDVQKAWQKLLRDAKLDYKNQPERQIHIHDLRRTISSHMASSGSSLLIVGKMLGHVSSASTQVYARLSLAPVRQEMEKAQIAMRALMPPAPKGRKAARRG